MPAVAHSAAIALATLIAPAAALADSVDLHYLGRGHGEVVYLTRNGATARVFAGSLRFDLRGGVGAGANLRGERLLFQDSLSTMRSAFLLGRAAAWERHNIDQPAVGLSDGQRSAIVQVLARAEGHGADAEGAAAQLAIWEIAHDFGSLDLRSGAFTADVRGPLADRVHALLTGAASSEGRGSYVTPTTSGTTGQIVAVPLPPAAALGGAGLIGAFVLRRRMARAQ